MEPAATRVFPSRYPRAALWALVLCFCGYVAVKVGLLLLILHEVKQVAAALGRTGITLRAPLTLWDLWYVLLEIILLGTVFCAAFTQLRLEAVRASVEADSDGLTVTDWRGRRRSLSWAEVQGVRIQSPLLGQEKLPRQFAIRVLSAGRSLVIPYLIGHRAELVEELTSRAGLHVSARSWRYRVYAR